MGGLKPVRGVCIETVSVSTGTESLALKLYIKGLQAVAFVNIYDPCNIKIIILIFARNPHIFNTVSRSVYSGFSGFILEYVTLLSVYN